MHTRFARFLLFASIAIAPVLIAQTPARSDTTTYLRPPQPIVDAFDAQPLPQTILSPTRQFLALTYQRPAWHRRPRAARAPAGGRARQSEDLRSTPDAAHLRRHLEAD